MKWEREESQHLNLTTVSDVAVITLPQWPNGEMSGRRVSSREMTIIVSASHPAFVYGGATPVRHDDRSWATVDVMIDSSSLSRGEWLVSRGVESAMSFAHDKAKWWLDKFSCAVGRHG